MTGLLRAEIRKLRTVRTTWAVSAIGWIIVAFGSVFLVLEERFSGRFRGSDAEVAPLIDQVGATSVIVLVVALLAMTTEFRHGTIGRTLQLTPSRTRVFLAKLAVGAGYALAFFVTGLVVVALAGLLGVLLKDASLTIGSEAVAALWHGPVGLVLTAMLGVAVGSLVRSQVLAITLALVWVFVAEQLVAGLLPDVGRWLPFQALNAIFADPTMTEGAPIGTPLAPGVALLVFAAYLVLVSVPAVALLRVRDV